MGQLVSAALNGTGVGATLLKQFVYGYDPAGNRTSEEIQSGTNAPTAISVSSYNSVNQLVSRSSSGGPLRFKGSLNETGTVTVAGGQATMRGYTNFTGFANVGLGTNVVQVIASDYSGHFRTNNFQVIVTNNGVAETLTFDLNGNETSVVTATSTNTYQWDAANRLTQITQLSTNNTQLTSRFAYDGFGRRIQIIELQNGVAVSTNRFVWCGTQLCEQRDATGGTVTKRFFGEGEQISGTSYFFARDHLGSVREVVNTAGVMQARYDYDPYGRLTVIAGSFTADFGYAGMYYHPASGLNLTLFRAYDSDLGRWPNHDPIGERGGINLYGYVHNNPVNRIDPFGLLPGWSDLFPDPGQSGSEEGYWSNMANNDAQIENAVGAQEGYMDDQRQTAQFIMNPNEGFLMGGVEVGRGPAKVEGMLFGGKCKGRPLYGGLGAIGNGASYGGEWNNQTGGEGVLLLDPGAGYGFYASQSGDNAGGFAYVPIGFPGFELFFGVGGGWQH